MLSDTCTDSVQLYKLINQLVYFYAERHAHNGDLRRIFVILNPLYVIPDENASDVIAERIQNRRGLWPHAGGNGILKSNCVSQFSPDDVGYQLLLTLH